ncbi:MAG TPA: alpha/beta fold hydrolase [Vicinamibacterales bacterium]|nr:alpha/beta fold hydrolase [Vicinamibacterales bacterium]
MTRTIAATIALALAGQTAPGAQGASESPVTLRTPSGTIAGTLTAPAAPGKVPVALIIAGSGPTDRDGNSSALPEKNNAYKLLATALAASGVASVRYDKRGIGESQAAAAGGEAALRFDTYIDDAAAWVDQLHRDPRFSKVIVVGHSEGSLIGMIAGRKAKAEGFVSIAGPARRASDTIRDQLRPQLATLPELQKSSESILAALEAGTVVDPLPQAVQSVPGLASLFRPSVQPYLISWLKYVPATEIAALTMPVLIVQGTTDIQVDPGEAKALLKAAKPSTEVLLINGMNHVMKEAPADRAQNLAAYSDPNLPIVPEVPRAIVALARRIGTP